MQLFPHTHIYTVMVTPPCRRAMSLQSYQTLCNPVGCSLTGSSVHQILHTRVGCHARDLPNPGIKPGPLMSPALPSGFFTTSTTWAAPTPNIPC